MEVGVLGAGAIGCYTGVRLKGSDRAGVRLVLVGRSSFLSAVRQDKSLRATSNAGADIRVRLEDVVATDDARALADCEVILVCVKGTQTEAAAKQLNAALGGDSKGADKDGKRVGKLIVSMQNGVDNARIIRRIVAPRHSVVPCVVQFNCVWMPNGAHFHCSTQPPEFYIERAPKDRAAHRALGAGLAERLAKSGFRVQEVDVLRSYQYTKLLVNLMNPIGALSGLPLRAMLSNPWFRLCAYKTIAEAMEIYTAVGIRPARIGLPPRLLCLLLRMPQFVFWLVINTLYKIDPRAKLSMLQDLERGRLTEIAQLSGEVVRLAESKGLVAPVNGALVNRVRAAEQEALKTKASPRIKGEHLAEILGVRATDAIGTGRVLVVLALVIIPVVFLARAAFWR